METVTKITYEEFLEKYKPIKNEVRKDAPFDGLMFETFGEELGFVQLHADKFIWTLLDEDDTIVCGYQVVNRCGYFLCTVPFEGESGSIEIEGEEPDNDIEFDTSLSTGDHLKDQEITDIEVSGVRYKEFGDTLQYERCEDKYAMHFSVYLKLADGKSICIADCTNRDAALNLKDLLLTFAKSFSKEIVESLGATLSELRCYTWSKETFPVHDKAKAIYKKHKNL